MEKNRTVVVIGGGAAGFFSAIACAESNPAVNVILLEKSSKLLSKVRVSGGGRCNVTHACFEPSQLITYYPRGSRELLGPFHTFSPKDTIEWFRSKGVELKTEKDGRMFPVSDDSSSIVDCLMAAADKSGVEVRKNSSVKSFSKNDQGIFELKVDDEMNLQAHALIIASGGTPQIHNFNWLQDVGHTIIPPVPSLFTFNIPENPITALMGISIDTSTLKIQGVKYVGEGPLLITHWGLSGPAVLKLSSVAARKLAELNYNFIVQVSWLNNFNEEELRETLQKFRLDLAKRKVSASNPFHLPKRLWEFLLSKAIGDTEADWAGLNNESIRKLSHVLVADTYQVRGKTTFKEEFVTCGGVSLKEIDFKTMQSKKVPGLFFAGEVLDIDALTGGFNFQAAWTCGYIAGKSAAAFVEA